MSISNEQVSEIDIVPAGASGLLTWITLCDAAQMVCSMVPGTTVPSQVTPSVPTTPGQSYEARTSFFTKEGGHVFAAGRSPLVPA
ncbi:hypothetical protein [Actinocrispum wychmicini]|uniref:Uncharacterized protein n=1 Tax=Actinocrispum wychmicini TaxID=1213861 RepID=A0A4V2S891_9PSEU|nr:hypothetical protein [Actinocrispum wychmicini]TCO62870.1 hypothetical protein EV192_1021010 [Actinocrispum wychmicini]